MKNLNSFRQDLSGEKQAQIAILQIKKWVEQRYPRLAYAAKTKMIMECLIELTEEKNFLAAAALNQRS